jgi:hypothetical protein
MADSPVAVVTPNVLNKKVSVQIRIGSHYVGSVSSAIKACSTTERAEPRSATFLIPKETPAVRSRLRSPSL